MWRGAVELNTGQELLVSALSCLSQCYEGVTEALGHCLPSLPEDPFLLQEVHPQIIQAAPKSGAAQEASLDSICWVS